MRTGRPTKCTPELIKEAENFIHNHEEYGWAFPSKLGICDACDISERTLYNWAKDENKPEFLQMLEFCNREQERVAWQKGLNGEYNAGLVKLLLTKHGYSEKSHVEAQSPVVKHV